MDYDLRDYTDDIRIFPSLVFDVFLALLLTELLQLEVPCCDKGRKQVVSKDS